MILRLIRVEGWRCFVEAVQIGPLTDGLNVIHGPNGIGKSTLMMALVRGLFDNHNVGGEAINGLRPWGRQLNPKVTIEFEQDGVTYRLQKQFLGSATAELARQENGRFVPLAEGRAADDQARQILSGEAPGRGVTDQRHWGVAQILWATQGNLQIDELSAGTRATIQDAIGTQISGPGAESLAKRIADAYDQFFTPGGKPRRGASAPAVVGLQSQLEAAQTRGNELLVRLEEFDTASRRIEDLRHKTEQSSHSEVELTEKLKQSRQHAQAYEMLLGQRKLYEKEVGAAEDRYKSLEVKIKTIGATRDELKTAGEQHRRLEDDAPVQAKQVEQSREQTERAKKAVDQVRTRREQVQSSRKKARLADRFATAKQTQADLDRLLGQIESAQRDHDELRKKRDEFVAPDAKTLQQIKKTARARDDARLQLDAAVITVRILPETEIEIEITSAEQPGAESLRPETAHTIKGAPEVAFRIPGVASFEATGPTQGVDQLRKEWEEACAKLDEQTAGLGTKNLDRLERLCAQAVELDGQISGADLKIRTLLGDRQLDAIHSEQARAARIVDEILADFPVWHDTPPDAVALVQEADEVEQRFTADFDTAEREYDLARDALNLAMQKQSGHESDLKHARDKIEDVEKRLAALCDDSMTDDDRSAKLTEIALERDAAQGKLAQANEQLESIGDDPSKLVDALDRQVTAVRQEASDAAGQLNTEEGRLQQIAAEAPYSALAAIEEEINRLRDEIDRQQIRIDAVRLLHETLAEQKRDVLQSVLDPVRIRANQTLQRIAGTRFSDIHFDESLLPQSVTPRSVDATVALDQISGGEREQLHFAVRLALADVTFNNERQLVVLDDVFNHTDTTRLARVATILDEATDRFQIVLLTCHKERYRGLPNATFFDLEAIVSASSSV